MTLVDSVGFNLNKIEPKRLKQKSFFVEVFKNLFLILFFSFFVFITINLPAYYQIGSYKFRPNSITFNFPTFEEMKAISEGKSAGFDQQTPPVAEDKKIAVAPEISQYSDNTIFIPKIGVKAPIGWDIASDNLADELEKHVVHIQGSKKPGENGNVFVTGHSSNYWWKEGDFNTVFALLPELKTDDQIVITYQGKFHYYKVREAIEVKPKDVSQYFDSSKEQLTLMTCVPVGTNLKRLLIFAEPIKK